MFQRLITLCIGILLLSGGCSQSASVATTESTTKPARSEAIVFSRKLGLGINLGNTLEATGDWIAAKKGNTVTGYETAWGAPVTTKAMFDGFKAAGFNFVRIPVAWSNMMGLDYTINKALMDRVEEVAKYGLDNDMYVMIDIHWDGGWIHEFSTDYDGTMKRYKALWSQIADRFKGYSDHLIFESLNEEASFGDLWNHWTNVPDQKDKAYEIVNAINQAFTDLVRASGGNNRRRYLLIAGYGTDIGLTVDPAFKMPRDPAAHSMVSVHYYSPSTFAILEKDADWGKAQRTWGTPAEVEAVKRDMLPLKARFLDNGIPVVIGEFGVAAGNKDPESVVKYNTTVCETAYLLGCVPVLWDTGRYFNRSTLKWNDPQLGKEFARIAAAPRP
jgi:endoglucanase